MFTLRACAGLLLTSLVLMLLQSVVHGQNYHYSNGWHPGKRSRPLMASLLRANLATSEEACSFRPQVLTAINNIVQVRLN